jgi:valyl-tRNA synthetase
MLHPFMPFLTEELWRSFGSRAASDTEEAGLLALATWPDLDGLDAPEAEAEIGFVVDLISELRSVRAEVRVPAGQRLALVLVQASSGVRAAVDAWRPMIERLGMVAEIRHAETAPTKSAQVLVRGALAALPLEGIIDLEAERRRLAKDIEKTAGEIARIEGKLGNADFIARAPEEVVEEQKERQADLGSRLAKAREALARLAG